MDDGCLEIVFIFFAVIVGIGLAIWIVIATFLRILAWLVFYWCCAFLIAAIVGLIVGLFVPLRVLSGHSRTQPDIATPDEVAAERVTAMRREGLPSTLGGIKHGLSTTLSGAARRRCRGR